MRRLWRCSFFIRFVLWAGIVFLGGIVYAQEKNIDTLHIFKADTVRLGFDDVLRLSVQYDSVDKDDWRYLYRWNTGERTDAVRVKFEGKRKLLYIGQRFSAIHWPEEYDTFFAAKEYIRYATDPKEDTCVVCAPTLDASTYVWHNNHWLNGELLVVGKEQCIYAHPKMFYVHPELALTGRPLSSILCCSPTVSIDPGLRYPGLFIDFDTVNRIKKKIQGTAQQHNLNVWDMPRGTQIYARLGDTLSFFSEPNLTLYPEQEGHEIVATLWWIYS